MSSRTLVDRRDFLKTTAAGAGGLLVGFCLPAPIQGAEPAAAAESALNALIHIGTDDMVTLFIHKAEMGQGTVTSLSMLLAEELECDWTKIRTEFPGVDRAFGRPRACSAARAFAGPGIRCAGPAPRRARCSSPPPPRTGA